MDGLVVFGIAFGAACLFIGFFVVLQRRLDRQPSVYPYPPAYDDTPVARQPKPRPPVVARETVPVEEAPRPLPLGAWLPQVVRHRGHIMLVGETQSGKSTTAYALLSLRAETDLIIVIDPHEKKNHWPVQAANAGRDFAAIDRLFIMLDAELTRRYAPDEPDGPPLTIFIDEYPVIAAECPSARQAFKRLVREGAKVSLRVVLLAQESSTKGLGIEGEGPVRENLWKLLLGNFAAPVPGVAVERPAALERRGVVAPVDVRGLPHYARPVAPERRWGGPQDFAVEATPAKLIATGETADQGALLLPLLLEKMSAKPDTDPFRNKTVYEVLAVLLEAGLLTSETKALNALGVPPGSTSEKYATAKTKLGEARGRLKEATNVE